MKLKSILATIPISLLTLVLVIAFTAPATARRPSIKPKPSKGMVAKKTPDPQNDFDYWFDKGALCATYGNDRAAINYFQKAISIDPNRSGAYFSQGISYGQLGHFGQAVNLVNKAIEMEPQNGLYLYGRGRVYLLAGKQDQAMEDFKKAAELEDEDAQTYLKHLSEFHSKANHPSQFINSER